MSEDIWRNNKWLNSFLRSFIQLHEESMSFHENCRLKIKARLITDRVPPEESQVRER